MARVSFFRFAVGSLLTLAAMSAPVAAQTIFKPVAIVNDSAITGFDLAQRAQILTALGRASDVPDRLRSQSLDALVQDRLKLEAGALVGLTITDEIVELGLDVFAQQIQATGPELRARLNSQGISDQAINDLVGAETVWREVVRSRFFARSEPSEARIDDEIAQRSGISSSSYRLRELGLRTTGDPARDEEKRRLIVQIYEEVSRSGNFEAAIARYSESANSSSGGELGWVPADALPTELIRDLNQLEPGGVTRPVTVQGGVSLLQLIERRTEAGGASVEAASPELREQIRQQLVAEEINRLAEGYLQELRRDALIELR